MPAVLLCHVANKLRLILSATWQSGNACGFQIKVIHLVRKLSHIKVIKKSAPIEKKFAQFISKTLKFYIALRVRFRFVYLPSDYASQYTAGKTYSNETRSGNNQAVNVKALLLGKETVKRP